MKQLLTQLALVLVSIAAAIVLIMLGLYACGYPAHRILTLWAGGAIATRFDIAVSLKIACPLMLTGLAAGIAFRCGVINIGAEGQSLIGALAAAAFATAVAPSLPSSVAIPLALLAAILAGAAWAAIAALLDRYRGVPVVLSTILLNFIALQCVKIMLEGPTGPLKDPLTGVPQSRLLPAAYHLPLLPPATGMSSLHIGIFVALAAALIAWLIQSRTTFGFELRVTGLNPTAARLAGIPVAARQLSVMLLSGGLAGLAGAIQLLGITHILGISQPGIGYAGIAVALLGRLHPAGIILAALFFGMLDNGATNVEISRYGLPHDTADIVKGIIVLCILVGAAYISRHGIIAKER